MMWDLMRIRDMYQQQTELESKTELGTSSNVPKEYLKVVVNTNFPKDYYDVIVEDTGFESNAIYLKSHSSEFNDVEIARYTY